MRLNQEKIERMFNARGSMAGGGGGGSESIAGLASQVWTEENYVSKAFFNELFVIHKKTTTTVYDGDVVVSTTVDTSGVFSPNEVPSQTESTDAQTGHRTVVETEVDNIEAKKGLWTNYFLSALGLNSSGGGGGSDTLAGLLDVELDSPVSNQVLTYYNGKWRNMSAPGVDMNAVWQALGDTTTTQQIAHSHLTTALNGYATQLWVGQQGFLTAVTSLMIATALGYTPANNADLANYVTLATEQTISGYKTFSSGIVITGKPSDESVYNDGISIFNPNARDVGIMFGNRGGVGSDVFLAEIYSNTTNKNSYWAVYDNSAWTQIGHPKKSGTIALISDITTYLADYVTLATDQTISGAKTFSKGILVTGRMSTGGDDDGIRVKIPNVTYIGITLGNAATEAADVVMAELFITTAAKKSYWALQRDNATRLIEHPYKNGIIALTSDIDDAKTWVSQNYISISFFETLFNALDSNGTKVNANTTTGIASIKAMFGFWTEQYLSALGQNSGSGGGGSGDVTWELLADNTDTRQIALSHLTTALSSYATLTNLSDYVTIATDQTISGKKLFSSGLHVSGRSTAYGEDDGIVVMSPNQTYVGLSLCNRSLNGDTQKEAVISEYYIDTNLKRAAWLFHKNGTSYTILHPYKSGTIAVVGDIPTDNNQLTNGAGYITGITSSMVITALGYTPVNSTSLSDYVTLATEQTISGKKTFSGGLWITGKTNNIVDDGIVVLIPNVTNVGAMFGNSSSQCYFGMNTSNNKSYWATYNGTTNYTAVHPNKSGTFALTSDITDALVDYVTLATVQTITEEKTFSKGIHITGSVGNSDGIDIIKNATYCGITMGNSYAVESGAALTEIFINNNSKSAHWYLKSDTSQWTINHPKKNGTIAVTSDLDSYLPLSGGTMTGTITCKNIIPASNTTAYLGDNSHQFLVIYARYFNSASGQPLSIASADGDRDIWITASHDIGIGTNSPSYKLHVAGTFYASGSASFDGTAYFASSIYSGSNGGVVSGFHSIELNTNGSLSNYGGFIDFHYNGSSADYTSRIIEEESGRLRLVADNGVRIGNCVLIWEENNNALKIQRYDGTASNLYTTGGLSALGISGAVDGTVNASLIPSATGTYTLGNTNYRWKELYLASTSGSYNGRIYVDYDGINLDSANGGYFSGSRFLIFGRLAVGTDSDDQPNYDLYVAGNTYVGGSNSYFYGNVSVQSLTQRSDMRIKDVISDMTLKISTIAQAPLFKYKLKQGDGTIMVGSSAQYWDALLPEVIHRDAEGILGLDYGVTALASVISVAKEVTEHERRIARLEAENAILRAQIEDLKAA